MLNEIEKYLIEHTSGGNSENPGEDNDNNEDIPTINESEWTGEVQSPMLLEGMTAVYWSIDGGVTASTTQEGAVEIYSKVDENGKASSTGTDNPNFKWENWYAYIAGDNSTDTKTSRWANAVTDDGSYWVWIPRYKYKITEQPTEAGPNNAGKIEIEFIPRTDQMGANGYTTESNEDGEILTTDSNGYIIHPAFENGSSTGKNNEYANGEWNSELPGFWVAKYEMSAEDENGENISYPGNKELSDSLKMVSKPGVASWNLIDIGQAYQNCINYNILKNSHMTKASEWAAVAYLAHSQYGRNRNELAINNTEFSTVGIRTGISSGLTINDGTIDGPEYVYNTSLGMLASTTGNIYGVYDMNGGGGEWTAMWDIKGNPYTLTRYGNALDGTECFPSNGSSDRTKTAYSNGSINWIFEEVLGKPINSFEEINNIEWTDEMNTQILELLLNLSKIGDGIKEVYIDNDLWFNDQFSYIGDLFGEVADLQFPFMRRGFYGYPNSDKQGLFSMANFGSERNRNVNT